MFRVAAQSDQHAAKSQMNLTMPQITMTSRPLGLSDGMIFPESHFDLAAPNLRKLMRAAAADRPPLRGVVNVCVALVNFPDAQMPANNKSRIDELFFSTGKLHTGSVNEFYHDVSGGKISIAGKVVGPYMMHQSKAQYAGTGADGDNGRQQSFPNARTMAKDALEMAKADIDFSQFDNDKNGYVDAFIVLHAGRGAEQTGNHADLWSIKWLLPNVTTYNNTNIYGFLTVPEDAKTGVCAHELGHLLFGWPDFYDYSETTFGIGDWCLMAYGSWGGGGDRPCHPSAWCKVAQGWVDLTTENDPRHISLGPVQKTKDIRRVWKGGDQGSREYFLLENRQRVGNDESIPGSGLLVWHVDDSKGDNKDRNHRWVDLIQADGRRDMNQADKNQCNRGDATDPFPIAANNVFNAASIPNSNTYAGLLSQVSIANIVANGDVVSFDANVGGGVVGWQSNGFAPTQTAKQKGQLAAISRAGNHLEIFWIDQFDALQHAVWYEGQAWLTGELLPVTKSWQALGLTAVTRKSNTISLFWVTNMGTIEHMLWEEGKDWKQSTIVPAGGAAGTSQLSVISRREDTLELFWNANGQAWHAWWYENMANWAWRNVIDGTHAPNSAVSAVSRKSSDMDVFYIDEAGSVQQLSFTEGRNWKLQPIGPAQFGAASQQSGITAVSRQPDHLEVFWVRDDHKVLHAFIFGGQVWPWECKELGHPWAAAVGDITAIARSANAVDVFWTQEDGSIQRGYWRNGINWSFEQVKAADARGGGLSLATASKAFNSADVWALRNDQGIVNAYSNSL